MEQIETSTSGGRNGVGSGGVEPNKCTLLDQKN